MSEFEIMDRHFVELQPYGSFPISSPSDDTDLPATALGNDYILTVDGDVLTLKTL